MQAARITPLSSLSAMPVVGGLLMGVAFVAMLLFITLGSETLSDYPYAFLLPWILGLGIVLGAPSAYLAYKRQFFIANPIVFLTWTYLLPAFVLGGIFFAGGWSQPYFVSFIQDAEQTLPFTIVL